MEKTTTKDNKPQPPEIYSATLRYARISARKVNYVAELIRGLTVNRALEVLMFNPRRASYFLYKLLKSAISNAINKNNKVDVDKLYLKEVRVCGGPIMKRLGSAPRGRAVIIRRRFSHITIFLTEAKESPKKKQAEVISEKPTSTQQKKPESKQSPY
jgi:large subunit ribosomal protein L22